MSYLTMGSLFFSIQSIMYYSFTYYFGALHGGIMREFQSEKLSQKENTNHEETFCDDMNLCHLKRTCNTWTKNRLGRWYDFLFFKVPWQMLKVCLAVTLRTCFCGKHIPGRIQSHPKTVNLTSRHIMILVVGVLRPWHGHFGLWCPCFSPVSTTRKKVVNCY